MFSREIEELYGIGSRRNIARMRMPHGGVGAEDPTFTGQNNPNVNPSAPGGPNDPNAAPKSSTYDKFQSLLNPFNQALAQQNPQLLAYQQQVGGLGGKLGQVGNQYAQMAQGQDPGIEAQRQLALKSAQESLSRQGVTGGAAMDQLAKVNSQYDTMQQQNRQAGLAGVQNVIGGQSGLLNQQSGFGNDYLQNLLANPTLATSFYAAQQAGKGNSGGGGKK